jgi:hypothetical protein
MLSTVTDSTLLVPKIAALSLVSQFGIAKSSVIGTAFAWLLSAKKAIGTMASWRSLAERLIKVFLTFKRLPSEEWRQGVLSEFECSRTSSNIRAQNK